MRQLFILFLLCTLTARISAQQTTPILEAMNGFDYEKALLLIEKESVTTPLLFQKVTALKGLNRFLEATDVLRLIVKKEPDNQRAILELAECCKLTGKFNEALDCYDRILQVNPDHKYTQIQQINLLCSTERFTDAHKSCSELMRNDSTATPLRLMGQIYMGMSRWEYAIDCYSKVVEKEPNDNASVARLANLYIKYNDFESAIAVSESYRQIDSTNLYVNRQNAQAYCLAKDYDTAVNRYEYLVSQGDSSMHTCYYLGMSYYAKEKFYEAHDFLKAAYQYDDKNVNLLYYLGKACAKTSWKEEGVELLEQALDIVIPSDSLLVNLYNGLIDCSKMAGKPHKQVEAYKELYKINPQKHTILYNIGSIYQDRIKNPKLAERYLERFLKTRPKETAETVESDGNTVVLNETTYYKAAERRLEVIRKEAFFKGETQ